MYLVIEEEYRDGRRDVDQMMRRLKALSAYSLLHPEILAQQEGPELLALGMFFGMTSNMELRRRNEGRWGLNGVRERKRPGAHGSRSVAWAAARRAVGTRIGEQLT